MLSDSLCIVQGVTVVIFVLVMEDTNCSGTTVIAVVAVADFIF